MESSRGPLTKILALGRAVRNRWRQSFVASITLVALLGVAAFALVIGRAVKGQIEDQAFERAKDTAQIAARAGFAPRLPPPGRPLGAREVAELDRQLASTRAREPRIDMRLWRRDGALLYARDRRLVGRRLPRTSTVTAALRGRSATAVRGATLQTAVPIVRRPGGPVEAALELSLPYGPVEADVRDRTRRLWIALGIVALLAYLLALPGLLRAGRALRAQYDPRRVELVRELRRALERDELELHFQPIAKAQTGDISTVEALIRWDHPRHGAMSPERFVAAVEGTDVVWPFTLRVFELAIEQCRRWRNDGLELDVAVNVSGSILPDRRLADEIEALLARCEVPASALEIEVTEGAVMQDAAAAAGVLRRLTEIGVGVIAIDDFGTGYSSLARLHELPLDTLKIDQSFVQRMSREGDETVVRSVVELAHALGLSVIAEGVEDRATWDALVALGCDFIQGYALTPALPADAFSAWLAARVPSSA
ncbi:MAG TPA: EAL domain-containing protein [Solirubrobacteraceae bacterium]|nr:EAL domain-containing protein [Solirubrobacteraceae bacterium]